MPPSITELSWMAGFFDGEGSVYISKRKGGDGVLRSAWSTVVISVTNTNRTVLLGFQKSFGGSISKKSWKNKKWKPGFMWKVKGADNAERFLKQVLPFLHLKTKVARIALRYLRLTHRRNHSRRFRHYTNQELVIRTELANRVAFLNHRGLH